MKKVSKLVFIALVISISISTLSVAAYAPTGNLYMTIADIIATTEVPGTAYQKEGNVIPYSPGLESALVYGNVVKAIPLTKGEYAGKWAEAFDEEEESIGYVDMTALTPMPEITNFQEPEPCRFTVNSPDLFLLPGSLSILDYTLPDDEPYCVLAGEAVDGIGTFVDSSGQNWTLLRFETAFNYDFGYRHAWTRSDNVMRLSQYEPDHAQAEPAIVPEYVRDFGKIPDKFRSSLLKNGFAIDATPIIHDRLRLDDLVESYPDSYGYSVFTPNFVTTDVFLHALHLVFSRGLKKIEEVDFAPALENMLKDALSNLDKLEEQDGAEKLAHVFDLARDFLTVPMTLIAPDYELPKPSERVELETELVLRAEGFLRSPFTGKEEDYSFYKPRGHYTSSETLSRYFRATAYLGGFGIPLNSGEPERDRNNTALIALLCVLFEDEQLRKQWEYIYEPLTFLIGEADDPSIKDYGPVTKKILMGDLGKLTDVDTLDALREAFIAATPAPRIIDAPTGNISQEEREEMTAGFRLMGRRFVLDAWVFAQLTSPNVGSDSAPRNLPKTADIMAVLGSGVAYTALDDDRRDIPKYADAFDKTKRDVYSFFGKWDGTFVSACLGTLGIYLTDRDSKQFFWNSPLWDAKKLLTSSASWTELKHDTVLYAKQNYAEMGSAGEWMVEPFRNPTPLGYVEPSPRTFGALAASLSRLQEIIDEFVLGEEENDGGYWNGVQSRVDALLECVETFWVIAEKEVREERLNEDDYIAISNITSYLNSNLLLDSDYVEEEDISSIRMALVSDVATDAFEGRVLHAATGTPRRIYVFVNDKWGGPRITVGYTYSFYEFPRSILDGRMTDEEWRELVYDKTRQEELEKLAPEWAEELFVR